MFSDLEFKKKLNSDDIIVWNGTISRWHFVRDHVLDGDMVRIANEEERDKYLEVQKRNTMKNIIAVGDTHGRNTWQLIFEKENPDIMIFIGDYFDSRDGIPAIDQIHNFRNICSLKKQFPERVVLLFGNHDFHYMRGITEHYAGHQSVNAIDIQEAIHEALTDNLLQMVFRYDNVLFSHAGLTKTWCKDKIGTDDPENPNFTRMINDQFKYQPNIFRFSPGDKCDMYGDEPEQSPIWVRPKALISDKIAIDYQVVGHTTQDHIFVTDGIVLIDTIGISGEYLKIYNNCISSATLDMPHPTKP